MNNVYTINQFDIDSEDFFTEYLQQPLNEDIDVQISKALSDIALYCKAI